jgi:acetyl/propionyl-CoA carboxylase alpha subunit
MTSNPRACGPGARRAAQIIRLYYDAMRAKVIGYGHSRAEAALRLERALHGARVHGVTTNLTRSSGPARASTCTGHPGCGDDR